ncbi:MAG: phosphoribosylanthranilate isomerase [Ruminococcaceae bacterium]|nr:phosphoribosylanthranilate isomerase [Oscillospiraceae bacterium]
MVTQIYSVISVEEAVACTEVGADNIGMLVADEGENYPCTIEVSTAIDIMKALENKALRILIPGTNYRENAIKFCATVKPDVLHLSNAIKSSKEFLTDLRKVQPNVKIMQAIGVYDESSIEEAIVLSEFSDYLLLDTYVPNPIGSIGAIGATHDWNISRKIVESVSIPVILAGGLGPDNVADAIRKVRPYGVDSLTKTSIKNNDGVLIGKDIEKVKLFCEIARKVGEEEGL